MTRSSMIRRARSAAVAALLVAAVLAPGLLAASGAEESSATAEKPEVRFLVLDYGRDKITDDLFIFKIMEEKAGVKVHPVPILEADYRAKMDTIIASGDMPDLVTARYEQAQQYGPLGLFVNYRPVLDSKLPNLRKMLQRYPEVEPLLPASDGGYYSFPKIDERFNYGSVIALRSDLLSALGMDKNSIQTLDDLYAYLVKTKGMLNGLIEYPWSPVTAGKGLFNHAADLGIGAPDALYFSPLKGAYTYGPFDPRFKTYMNFMVNVYKNKLVRPDVLSLSDKEGQEIFAKGKSAMFFYAEYIVLAQYDTELKQYSGNNSYGLTTIWPVSVDGVRVAPKRDHTLNDTFRQKAINAKSKVVDAVYKLVDYLYSDEGTKLFYWGQEGVHWKVNAKGDVDWMVDFGWNKDLVPAGTPNYVEFGLNNKRYVFVQPYLPVDAQMNSIYYDLENRYSGKLNLPDPMVSAFIKADENDQFKNIMTPAATYALENVSKFMMGARPMSEWDAFVGEMQKMNVQKAIDIYNGVYARMKAMK